MSAKQTAKFQELVAKLREIFQIDRPELDFGIYRILNARAGEINDYLENRLAEKVQVALAEGNAANTQQLQMELHEAEKQAQALGANLDDLPKVKDLRARLQAATAGSNEHENAVFSHLLTFFSRYYQDGDFISQRRYKGDTYAIPYAGEEVMLHWANKDQYYTKSGENFSNYSFKLEDGRTVHFRLVAADTAKDNRKDNDKERRFVLVERRIVTRIDEQGEEYEEEVLPVEEVDGVDGKELVIRFEYAAQPKGTKQDGLGEKVAKTVLDDAAVKARWLELGKRAPTEKNPQRTLLEKHLTDYTTKNNADYFIHKDLGGFLHRELDFYIKNEIMHLDDVQNAGAFADIEKSLRMIQCLRAIALELIAFLAQLENFQKRLWLKKKFVVSSHYCMTLDRVPEALWPVVVANERQWANWLELGVWSKKDPGDLADLKAGQYRMVDTSLFDQSFKTKLASAIPDLDASSDGLVIHGDNFQSLNLLGIRYKEQIKCVYIDPPYNTGSDGFIYKDEYKSSSWLTLIAELIPVARKLMNQNDSFFTMSIDKRQQFDSKLMLDGLLSGMNFINSIVNVNNPKGRSDQKHLPTAHDNILFYATEDSVSHGWTPQDKVLKRYRLQDKDGKHREIDLRKTGDNDLATDRPNMAYPFAYSEEKNDLYPSSDDEILKAGYIHIAPMKADSIKGRWRWERNTSKDNIKRLVAKFQPQKQQWTVFEKDYLGDDERVFPTSVWDEKPFNSERGTECLANLGFDKADFPRPKPVGLIGSVIEHLAHDANFILDFFAGSGTTAHAAIDFNRKYKSDLKYILVEQGAHFDFVLRPRIQKVVYSTDWKEGKPTAPETGISHCFKIVKLEGYEDTLNNLQFHRDTKQGETLALLNSQAKDDYLLHYMLDVESRGSLLSVGDFNRPFDYTLKVAVDSAGAYEARKVDLVETFNYLIGLRVKHIDAQPERGFVTVTGILPSGESCLVLWRNCEVLDYEGISKLCDKLAINPADNEFDVVYINGDHNIPTVLTQTAEEGGGTRVLKLRQIEPEFLSRMFSVEDV